MPKGKSRASTEKHPCVLSRAQKWCHKDELAHLLTPLQLNLWADRLRGFCPHGRAFPIKIRKCCARGESIAATPASCRRSSLVVPFPSFASRVRLVVSRLRGRAVRTSVLRLTQSGALSFFLAPSLGRLSSVDTASLAQPQSVPMRNLCCFILLRVGV
jgi:hypothetical protein